MREVQEALGLASVRTMERYRHCTAPVVQNHPFTEVRRRMHAMEKATDGLAVGLTVESSGTTDSGQDRREPLLATLHSIDIRSIQLPFEPLQMRSPAWEFLRLLKDRVIRGFLRHTANSPPT